MTLLDRRTLDSSQVIECAATLADAEGFEAVTLTRVADELGVRQPALYRHVDGYDALIKCLALRGRELLADALTETAVGVSGNAAVVAIGRAWRALVKKHPGLYAATDRYPCAGDLELEDAVERIVAIVARALASFDLDEDERMHVARGLRSAFHGFAHLESGNGHPHEHDLDDSFDHLLELLIAGIRHLESGLR
ncbi:MAG: WHG domain-containing protein [Acidimicrobiia bacterium]|nr:WHG domain-containing protein [Acidimicrobiia bacterium]MCY4456671.1 WHG domain-containing protein [Acidimicrobiaceae bacterium]